MTARKDFKRRVRERQAQTGESYMTAARHVRAEAGPELALEEFELTNELPDEGEGRGEPVPVVELIDLAAAAEPLGFRCKVVIHPSLAELVDGATALARLRDLLLATTMDGAFELMRSAVLRGERPQIHMSRRDFESAARFVSRAVAGLGGVSDSGNAIALSVDGKRGSVMVLFLLQLTPDFVPIARAPHLILTIPQQQTVDALRVL